MTKEQFVREWNYCAAISIAKFMRLEQVITEKEYLKIEKRFNRKYCPIIGGLRFERVDRGHPLSRRLTIRE